MELVFVNILAGAKSKVWLGRWDGRPFGLGLVGRVIVLWNGWAPLFVITSRLSHCTKRPRRTQSIINTNLILFPFPPPFPFSIVSHSHQYTTSHIYMHTYLCGSIHPALLLQYNTIYKIHTSSTTAPNTNTFLPSSSSSSCLPLHSPVPVNWTQLNWTELNHWIWIRTLRCGWACGEWQCKVRYCWLGPVTTEFLTPQLFLYLDSC